MVRVLDKVTGRRNSKYGPMNLHFNEKCLKNFGDENYYGPGQAFNYRVVTVNPKSKEDLNPADIDLLKLGILLHFNVWFLLYMFFLSYVKLFFLSGKKTFYHAYLTYIVYIDFFGNFSLCFLFLFLSMLLQSCASFSKYSAVGDSTKDILNQTNILLSFLCFVHLDQSYVFSLSTFKIQIKSKNILMYSMYPFYKNYTAY